MYKAGDPFLPNFDAPPQSAAILAFSRPQGPVQPVQRPAGSGTDGQAAGSVVSFAAMAERLRNRRRERR